MIEVPDAAAAEALGLDVIYDFLEASVRYLRCTLGLDAVVAALGGEPMAPADTIIVTIDFQGDIHGPVTWVFPQPIALELVRQLLSDPDPPPETATDGATELANILTGRASEVLETHGFRCEISVPRIHVGALPNGVAVRMSTANGPIDIVMSMSSQHPAA
jgi:CheY-specific phosphatase CheX